MKTIARLFALIAMASASLAAESAMNEDYDYEVPLPGTYSLPAIKIAADGDLLDSAGKPVRLARLTHGRITVMSFIYTRCTATKACPYATGVLRQLHEESENDPALANSLRLVSLSFDPENDKPERMAAYSGLAAQRPTAAPWHFLTAPSEAQLQPILRAYGQAVDRRENPSDPAGPLNHTLRVFLIDGSGRIRNIYSSGTLDPRLLLTDVRTLLMERDRVSPHSGLLPFATIPRTPQR